MSNSGVLGSRNLLSEVNQAVYVNNYSEVSAVTVSVCNKHHISSNVSIAVSTSATSPTNAEWLEYEAIVQGKGVLERSGIIITPGHYIVVKSSAPNVNAMVWGTELGTLSVSPVIITTNTVGPGPTFVGSSEFTVFAGDAS
jgi:hypothetical protein